MNYDSTATMYAYNFDTQSWSKFDGHSGTFQSQFVMSDDQELQTFDTTSEKVENLFVSTSNDATSTVKLKTKDLILDYLISLNALQNCTLPI